MMASQPDTVAAAASAAGQLSAVPVSAFQLRGAMERLAGLPGHVRNNAAAQALALQSYVDEEGFASPIASAALFARVSALARWTAAHDPLRQSDAESVLEAAACFPLTEGDSGIEFEPGGFQEMILFIEELPF